MTDESEPFLVPFARSQITRARAGIRTRLRKNASNGWHALHYDAKAEVAEQKHSAVSFSENENGLMCIDFLSNLCAVYSMRSSAVLEWVFGEIRVSAQMSRR